MHGTLTSLQGKNLTNMVSKNLISHMFILSYVSHLALLKKSY